jgi:hypothetical protein
VANGSLPRPTAGSARNARYVLGRGCGDRHSRLGVEKRARERRELHVPEETLILDAEADGLDVDRRGDAEPAIVLTTIHGNGR